MNDTIYTIFIGFMIVGTLSIVGGILYWMCNKEVVGKIIEIVNLILFAALFFYFIGAVARLFYEI